MNATQEQMPSYTGWAPAPGSVVRHNWPLPIRWAWWLAHRPLLVGLVALAVLAGVEASPVVSTGLASVVLAVLVAAIAMVLVVWWRAHPVTFHRFGGRVLLGLWRSFWA